jgi:hypothetical protein
VECASKLMSVGSLVQVRCNERLGETKEIRESNGGQRVKRASYLERSDFKVFAWV